MMLRFKPVAGSFAAATIATRRMPSLLMVHASARPLPTVSASSRSFSRLSRPAFHTVEKPFASAFVRARFNSSTAVPPPPPPPKKRWGFWRTAWRVTYISFLAGVVAISIAVYRGKHPIAEQLPHDPEKKTLVILGSGWGSVSLLKNIDTENYNVIVISPRNFFLFTPLLPSCTTGTIEHRSIMEPIRGIIRNKTRTVTYYEAHATKVDPEKKVVLVQDATIDGSDTFKEVPYDYLVIGVGAMNSTFGIPGVQEHACFLKEIPDAQKIRKKIMDCIESASFKELDDVERKRLLHTVVVGGGPTGVEFAAELQDFFEEDLKKWIPEIAKDFKVTLVEALPNVLPSFSKQLIDYTESTFKEEQITVLTKTMVKKVTENTISAEATKPDGTKEIVDLPYGLLVWATGNAVRPIVRDLMSKLPAQKNSRRGLLVNEYLVVEGTEGVWALGDCSATKFAPTAQVAAQEGSYLAGLFNQLAKANDLESEVARLELKAVAAGNGERDGIMQEIESKTRKLRRAKDLLPFEYSHQGSLAYIGSDKAVADVSLWGEGKFASGGGLTYVFWRSAYISMCFSVRNKLLVATDWLKVKMFGRDVSRE